MKRQLIFSLFVFVCYTTGSQPLAGTDDLDRTLQSNGTVANHPEMLQDYKNNFWVKRVYKPGGPIGMHFWGKRVYGYYRGADYWAHMRSIQLLTDTFVDLLVIDATITLVYPKQANELMNEMDAVRAPYYYPDCWFYLDGKPLIIWISKVVVGKNYLSFFTFRESQWPNESHKVSGWPWIEFSYTGDTQPRNHTGAVSKPAITCTNITGRNDFHFLKIAPDRKNIWFNAETTAAMTPNSGDNWMRLYLDMDWNPKTRWLVYDYRFFGGNKLQKYVSGKWADFQKINFVVERNKQMITPPLIQLVETCHHPDFEFKWSDNMQNDADPLDWYVNGDVPLGTV